MADYYSILTKTISGLKNNTPDLRQAVYNKARTAIEAQLRQLDPAPGEETIQAQLGLLEDAIVVIESEYPEDQVAAQPAVEPEPVAAPVITPTAPPEPDPIPEPIAEPAPAPVMTAPAAPSAPMAEPPTANEIPPAPAVEEIQTAAPIAAETANIDFDTTSSASTAAAPSIEVEKPAQAGIPPEMVEQAGKSEKSGFGGIVKTLVILGVLGGAGFLAWLNKDAITGQIASLTQGSGEQEVAATQEEVVPDPEVDDKETVRLGDGEVAPEPEETEPETPIVIEQPEPEPQVEEEVVEPVEEEAGANPEPATSAPLGEVAYLYEEGSAGAGATRSNARINWSLASVKPSEALPAEPVIVGTMEVPEKGLGVEITIKRNVDEALSASHIIEMTFELPEGFAGGEIDNIARFVMKPSEEARGEPLVAVPVKVSDGYFLIALDNLEQAVQVNSNLLVNSGWIDVPISYSTGKRALLTLEKGGSGDLVFKQAFEDWQNR